MNNFLSISNHDRLMRQDGKRNGKAPVVKLVQSLIAAIYYYKKMTASTLFLFSIQMNRSTVNAGKDVDLLYLIVAILATHRD